LWSRTPAASPASISLEGGKAKGPDIKIRLNRGYLIKALDHGLIDAMSALQLTREDWQMVVMPVRVADVMPADALTCPSASGGGSPFPSGRALFSLLNRHPHSTKSGRCFPAQHSINRSHF